MKIPKSSVLLRVFIGEMEKYKGKPSYEAIVLKAREMNLAGATVLRGIMGFGATSRGIRSAKMFEVSEDLPVVVEIVDSKKNITKFVKAIEPMVKGGLVTMEKAVVARYKREE